MHAFCFISKGLDVTELTKIKDYLAVHEETNQTEA